jgi:tRNA-2-methylthio-N6-dimethylallyladenosine synthase
MSTYYIKTFGCQMNVNDSEIIAGQLEDMGYQAADYIHSADIIILNTCCVRKKVEHKIYSMAGKVSQIKEENPNVVFGICGCLAQKEKENIQKSIPLIDLIFGPSQTTSFRAILEKYFLTKKIIVKCNNREPFDIKDAPIKYNNAISAFVQIMKGCNNFCSYCIVPFTRGPEESRPAYEICCEIEKLANIGYKEIFLLGQNVNSYGNGMNKRDNFLTLLSKINKIHGIERIRFTTSHPKDFNLGLIEVIKNGENICEHIHLPIQSGSDKILKRMNRKYTMEQYYQIVKYIRKNMPDASITTDVMVGFPGETDEDFRCTVKAFQEIQFDSAYTFMYSNREKTLASLFNMQVDYKIKKERLWELIDIQKNISYQLNEQMIGKTVEILIENTSKKGVKHQYWGKTRNNKVVVFLNDIYDNLMSSDNSLVGNFADIRILKVDSYTLYGELINVKKK